MQLTIIEARSLPEKQNMFECADVLNEICNAVSNGKKALRLDYTPYGILEGPKHWKKKPQTVQEKERVDPEELERRRGAV